MDVVNKLKECETASQDGHQDVPVNEIIIESVEVTDITEITEEE
jgi:peptidyl-prolyl cis-trans isomerase B (cyclophilin B)